MVVTNREQEKELKAYTCKTCGSTLFIARNREWFFKGDTGLGGLGCFTCGAKGADNFVMDRDRIVEDVGDDDDYFDYERPLDFVTAAERRALLKKAKGNEEVANQMLIDQAKTAESRPEGAVDAEIEKTAEETEQETTETGIGMSELDVKKEAEEKPTAESRPEGAIDAEIEKSAKEAEQDTTETEIGMTELDVRKEEEEKPTEETKGTTGNAASSEEAPPENAQKKASKKKKSKKAKKPDPVLESEPSLDDLDLSALGMDDL